MAQIEIAVVNFLEGACVTYPRVLARLSAPAAPVAKRRSAVSWPHSSLYRYVKQSILRADWGLAAAAQGGRFGE